MATAKSKQTKSFSDEEREAMKERVLELKGKADGESAVLAKIAEMPEPDKSLATKIHAIVKKTAPMLSPKTWYGMPAYATKDGKIVCFFQGGYKFKYRYATLGFQQDAHLDAGHLWPTSWAITKLGPEEEKEIVALVEKAVR